MYEFVYPFVKLTFELQTLYPYQRELQTLVYPCHCLRLEFFFLSFFCFPRVCVCLAFTGTSRVFVKRRVKLFEVGFNWACLFLHVL